MRVRTLFLCAGLSLAPLATEAVAVAQTTTEDLGPPRPDFNRPPAQAWHEGTTPNGIEPRTKLHTADYFLRYGGLLWSAALTMAVAIGVGYLSHVHLRRRGSA